MLNYIGIYSHTTFNYNCNNWYRVTFNHNSNETVIKCTQLQITM